MVSVLLPGTKPGLHLDQKTLWIKTLTAPCLDIVATSTHAAATPQTQEDTSEMSILRNFSHPQNERHLHGHNVRDLSMAHRAFICSTMGFEKVFHCILTFHVTVSSLYNAPRSVVKVLKLF